MPESSQGVYIIERHSIATGLLQPWLLHSTLRPLVLHVMLTMLCRLLQG